jgi:hypothetical protein
LALVYIIVISTIVGALAQWTMNDLNNTGNFSSVQTLQSAATSATEVAIQSIRYTPLLGANQTVNASPPSYCWGNSAPSQFTVDPSTTASGVTTGDPLTMDAWCSTVWTPLSAASRVVTISTCLSTYSNSACADSPYLQAVVTFDDYPSAGSAPIQGACALWCGTGMTVDKWIWGTGVTDASAGIPASATYTIEPSSTSAGVTTGVSVSVLDSQGNPAVGDTVSMLVASGPGGFSAASTLTAMTNSSGIASFSNLILNTVGNYTLTATVGTLSVNSTSFSVGQGTDTITITSAAPTNAVKNGATYTATATTTSGLAVQVTSATSSVCSVPVNSNVVSFPGSGTCTLDFNDLGNTNFAPAPQVTLSFTVSASNVQLTLPTSVTLAYGSVAGSVMVSFNASSNAPGGQTYTVKACTNASMTTACSSNTAFTSGSNFTGLSYQTGIAGSTYYFTVTANSSTGYLASASTAVASQAETSELEAPGTPTVATGTGTGNVTATFSSSGGIAPSSYTATACNNVQMTGTGTGNTCTSQTHYTSGSQITGLSQNTYYYVQITAVPPTGYVSNVSAVSLTSGESS